jgi:hypothetical protein
MVKCIAGAAGEETPLRRRMLEDMDLASLSEATQDAYIRAVCALQTHLGRRPDQLSENDLRSYLLYLRDEKKIAKGTFQATYYGLKFFFYRTLDLDWSLFTKKKCVSPTRSGYLWLFLARTVIV